MFLIVAFVERNSAMNVLKVGNTVNVNNLPKNDSYQSKNALLIDRESTGELPRKRCEGIYLNGTNASTIEVSRELKEVLVTNVTSIWRDICCVVRDVTLKSAIAVKSTDCEVVASE